MARRRVARRRVASRCVSLCCAASCRVASRHVSLPLVLRRVASRRARGPGGRGGDLRAPLLLSSTHRASDPCIASRKANIPSFRQGGAGALRYFAAHNVSEDLITFLKSGQVLTVPNTTRIRTHSASAFPCPIPWIRFNLKQSPLRDCLSLPPKQRQTQADHGSAST